MLKLVYRALILKNERKKEKTNGIEGKTHPFIYNQINNTYALGGVTMACWRGYFTYFYTYSYI